MEHQEDNGPRGGGDAASDAPKRRCARFGGGSSRKKEAEGSRREVVGVDRGDGEEACAGNLPEREKRVGAVRDGLGLSTWCSRRRQLARDTV